jgi:hypothetical protein
MATAAGIEYALSLAALPPAGMQMTIDNAGTDYCALLSGTTGTLHWSSFNTKCWDPTTGTTLSGPPNATHVAFQMNAGAEATTGSFCVTNLALVCEAPGGSCAADGTADCCQSPATAGNLGAVCLSDDNACHSKCTSSSECKSGCCLALQNVSYGACGASQSGAKCL